MTIRAEDILAEARELIERGRREAEQRKNKMNAEWETKQKASQDAFKSKMIAQNNAMICRAFGVTPEWCRANGVSII